MSEVAPTEEVVKALLDYLVDPMLPLRASSNNPPSLDNQQSVAKQMQAVVLLYNYYQRKQHPELRFLEYESFCKLAVNLKPALMAHMKLTHQTETTLSKDLENHLSVAEKAIMDACNISLSLDALKDAPSTEAWPISKVSVLLIDSKKENCVLLYSSITNGVWSVIEKCLDVSNLDSEIPLEGTVAEKMRMQKKARRDEKDAKGSCFQHLAFSAVKEVTGINQSELMVLETHVVYSLSKEKTAAYFYIMQCNQPSKDFEVPIRDAIESLQGPLLRWTSGSWTLTQMVEYYNVLPYAMIMLSWYLRDVTSDGSVILNVSSCEKSNEICSKKIAESEQVILNDLQNFSVELGNMKVNGSVMLESDYDGELNKTVDIYDQSCINAKSNSNEVAAVESSTIVEKEAQEMEKSDKSCDVIHPAVEELNCISSHHSCKETIGPDNSNLGDLEVEENEKSGSPKAKQLENCIDAPCSNKETIGTDASQRREIKVGETEKSDKSRDMTHPTMCQLENCIGAQCSSKETIGTDDSQRREIKVGETEKFDKSWNMTHPAMCQLENCIGAQCSSKETIGTDDSQRREIKVGETEKFDKSWNMTHPTMCQLENCFGAQCSSKETIGTDNSMRGEKEVEETEKSDKFLDINHLIVKQLENNVDFHCIGKETFCTNNFKRAETEVEDMEISDSCSKINHSNVKEATGDNSERIEKLAEDREKSDKCCDAVDLTVKQFTSDDSEGSKQNPTSDLQISSPPPSKKLKMNADGFIINISKNGYKNKNDVPIRVYRHQKRKNPLERNADVGIDVDTAGFPKSLAVVRREVAGNGINGSSHPNLNGTALSDCAIVSTLAKKDIAMTQTALQVLFSKRAKLCHHQRIIKDEVALCERNIQNILDGNDDALDVKLDAIMDGCKGTWFKEKNHDESYQPGEGHPQVQCTRGKRLSDAIFNLRSPIQDLNDICCENNWALAMDCVSVSDGGFRCTINVKGIDFDSTYVSELFSTPQQARESAAARMIAQFQEMAGKTK